MKFVHNSLLSIAKKSAVLALVGLILVPQIVNALSPEQQQIYNEGVNYFDLSTCGSGGSSSGPATTSGIGGDLQSLAQQIINNKSITYDPGNTREQFVRMAAGQKAQRDSGATVDVEPIILVVILHLAQSHKVQISALTNGSSHDSATNPHGSGKAVDIDFLDGQGTNGYDTVATTIENDAAQVLPSGARFGRGSNGGVLNGSIQINGKTFGTFPDNPNHVHVDVVGVAQSDDDAAVQAAGGGTSTGTTGTSTTTGTTGGSTGTSANAVSFDDSQSSDTGGQTTIDDDGIDPSPTGSSDHQSSTSYADGKLGALHTSYFALNPGWAQAHGLVLGDVGMLTYKGKIVYAVYGDNHTGNTPHAEISVKAAMGLTGISDPAQAENSLSGVHFAIYPGTHTQLNGSVDQSKIDQIGQQASGGVAPSSSTTSSDGCCGSSGTGSDVSSLTGSDNEQKAFNFFVQEGLTAAQAAGILANLYNESGVDPTSGAPPRDGVGFGIAQWTFNSRQAPLIAYAASQGKPVTDLLVQLQYMWHELNTDYKSTLDGLKQITGNDAGAAGQAAVYFRDHYEACDTSVSSCSDRGSVGTKMFNLYGNGGGAPGSTGGGTSSDSSCSAGSTGSTVSGQYTNPFPKGWQPSRLDMGYDGTFKGQIVAPFSGTITFAADSFSNWGGYVEIKADQKIPDLPSSTFYFAEGISKVVSNGQHVTAGEPIAIAVPSIWNGITGNIEFGLAKEGVVGSPTDPLAETGISNPKQMVLDFVAWVEKNLNPAKPTSTGHAGYA